MGTCERFARDSIRKGALTDPGLDFEALTHHGERAFGAREAVIGLYILIANELCPDYGLFNISAPSLSRVKGPLGLDRC